MRVLHTIHSVNPANGGPIELIRLLASIGRSRGDQVSVVCLDDPSAPFVQDFPGTVYALGPASPDYGFTSKLVPWLKSESQNYDVVIVNGIWQYPSLGTWLALKGSGTPYVLFTHGMLDPWFQQAFPLKHLKKSIYWLIAERMVLRDAAAVIFTSEEERILASQSFRPYACHAAICTPGTAAPQGDPIRLKEIFLSRFQSLQGKALLLFLGRLHFKKGCESLVQAFLQLTERYPHLQLVMAGPDSAYGEQIKKKYCGPQTTGAERVTWTGMLKGDLKWGALNAADALILPSHQENFGVVVAESLACGKPVLLSNKVNIWKEIIEDDAGLVEPDTLEGTANLIQRWLNLSESEQRKMQIQARNCFRNRFEVTRMHDRLAEILQQTLDNSASTCGVKTG